MAKLTKQQVTDLKEAYRIHRPSVTWLQLQSGDTFGLNLYHFKEFLHDNHFEMWKALQGNPTLETKADGQILLDEWFANMLITDSDGQEVLNLYYANR